MFVITDYVSQATLQHNPPRQLPASLPRTLLAHYLQQHARRIALDPILLNSLAALVALALLRTGWLLWLCLGIIILARLGVIGWQMGVQIRETLALLKDGRVVAAHILQLRPAHSEQHDIDGAYLDCAIPLGKRRVAVGSVWLADIAEAEQLQVRKRLGVLCLERAPATWVLLEEIRSEICYQPVHRNGQGIELPNDPAITG